MNVRKEMAKRMNVVDRGSMDYVAIPDSSKSASATSSGSYCLKMFIAVVIGVAVLGAALSKFGLFNTFKPVRAGCVVAINFSNSCDEVHEEIGNRVNGQPNLWHDPHNNGSYAFVGDQNGDNVAFLRTSGSGSKVKYTDAVNFAFTSSPDDQSCLVRATSDSQVFSILDFGTNFCNINNLYSSDALCRPFKRLIYTYNVEKCTDSNIKSCYTA